MIVDRRGHCCMVDVLQECVEAGRAVLVSATVCSTPLILSLSCRVAGRMT